MKEYDLIIIGGGINGAGVARDAALRGLKTILLEKRDFGGGTSSCSSRLIHGGLRYLEYFEFPLVREALKEREILLRTAPHLVSPLLLTIPIYSDRSRPYRKIWAGMILYDLLSFDKTLPLHRMLPQAQFKQLFPSVNSEGLSGGAQYYDAQVAHAERLCLENILAASEAGATTLNYTEVIQLNRQGDRCFPSPVRDLAESKPQSNRLQSLICRDVFTKKELIVQGHQKTVFLNTSGPWVDRICNLGVENGQDAPIGDRKKIGGTKGSHIIVAPFPGAPETAFYVEAKSDGRPFFIIPWLDMYLIGTTDLRYHGDLDRIKASDEEIDYLLEETNNIFSTANLSREDVKFTYSGVRPLPYKEEGTPGSVTRKHLLYDHSPEGVTNLISLIGGKLTTYRHVAEEIVDAVYGKINQKSPPCPTDSQPLPGYILANDSRIQEAVNKYKDVVSLTTINHLFSLYGSRANGVLALTEDQPELADQIIDELPDIKAQIVYAVRSELAQTLVDIARRRTSLAIKANYGKDLLPIITETLKQYCGWTEEKCIKAVQEYHSYLEENCIPDYQLKENQ